MIRIHFFTYLLFSLLYFPFTSFKPLSSPPSPTPASILQPEVFRHISQEANLKLEVFNAKGEAIPATIYRYHQAGQTTYETGGELPKGLYLIKLISPQGIRLYKLMKMQA